MSVEIRAATPADLSACARVCVASLADLGRREGRPDLGPDADAVERLLGFGYRQAPAGTVVAEAGGRIVAFASAWPRDGLWWLGFLFGLPEHQSAGVGRALLGRALAPGAGAPNAFTFASSDPRAVSLYLGAGMRPWSTALSFSVDAPREPASASHALSVAPLTRSSLAFERERFGYARGPEHRFLHEEGASGFAVMAADDRKGFFYVDARGRIGPFAVDSPELVPATLDLALAAARDAGHARASLIVPNENDAALRWLAATGARVEGVNLFMSRAPLARLDRVLLGRPGVA